MADLTSEETEPSYEAVLRYCEKRNLALIDCGELHALEYEAMAYKSEHKKGKWKPHREHEYIVYDIPPDELPPLYHWKSKPTYKCSECGYISFDFAPNFCEECGADMRE